MVIFMDLKGQMSAEFLMMAGFMLIVSCSVVMFIGQDSELIHAMAAARTGASEGLIADSVAIYPDQAFKNYTYDHSRLLTTSRVKIVKISYEDEGFKSSYNRTHIRLRIHATGSDMNSSDLNCLGDRINYYARRSISRVFNTENLTNSVFNPAFTDRYVFTTADVKWI